MEIHDINDLPQTPIAVEYAIFLNVVQLQQLDKDAFESAFDLYHQTIEEIKSRIKLTNTGDDFILDGNEMAAKICYTLAREAEERALMD